jgi:DNA invertase Pin-like site-specific DNA recombinase
MSGRFCQPESSRQPIRARPGLRESMAACRAGDVLVVTKLDRLARSLPDARDIVAELTARKVKLSLGGSMHDPTDPVGARPHRSGRQAAVQRAAMVDEFESTRAVGPGSTEGKTWTAVGAHAPGLLHRAG